MNVQAADHFFVAAFSAIVEQSGIVVIGINSDAKISFWTKSAAQCFGYSEADILGADYLKLVPGPEQNKFIKTQRKIARGRSVPEIEMRHIDAQGNIIETTFGLFAMAPGTETVALATVLNITERKTTELALRESSAQIQAIVQTVLDGVITIDEAGTINAFNPAAEQIFQYKAHEVIGRNVSSLMPEPDHSRHDSYLSNHLKTGEKKIIGKGREVKGKRKDGSIFPMELAVNATAIEGKVAFVGVVKDISERKAAEQAMHELQARTEAANAELTATLEELRTTQEQLVQSEKMAALGQMVAGVAHEINTPVGVGITAASQMVSAAREMQRSLANGQLKRSALDKFLNVSVESADIVLRNLERAARLVNSFKQTSTDQSNNERRSFEIGAYTREVLESLSPLVKQHHARVELICTEPLQMHSYPGALAQVLSNMVGNAIDHAFRGRKNGTLTVRIWRHDDQAWIQIQDDGNGIEPAALPRLFDPFYTTARNRGNTGLGLNISYNLVTQVLLGEIKVSSEPGNGTCFDIHLPLKA